VKGKGVSFMENNNYFHGVAPTAEEAEAALKELEGDSSLSKALIAAGKIKTGGK
jgi:transketolase